MDYLREKLSWWIMTVENLNTLDLNRNIKTFGTGVTINKIIYDDGVEINIHLLIKTVKTINRINLTIIHSE